MPGKKLLAVSLLAATMLLAAQLLTAGYQSIYRIQITYVAEGRGSIGEDIFSKTFFLAPTIDGWQKLVNYTLTVNGAPLHAKVKRDSQGNMYLYPGTPVPLNGKVNITLVEYVLVTPPPQRVRREPPLEPCRPTGRPDMLSLEGFWSRRYDGATIKDLRGLASLLGGEGVEYVYRLIAWVISNTHYKLGVRGGVKTPTEFYVERVGACGDIHSFIVAMLRIKGIPSYLYYAFIYRENAYTRIGGHKASFELRNALPHMFAMARLCGKDFPIDVTYPAAQSPRSAVLDAGVNRGDNVIVFLRIIDADPNDYLLVYAPSNESTVNVYVKVSKYTAYERGEQSIVLPLLASILVVALAAYSLLKSTATVGADDV